MRRSFKLASLVGLAALVSGPAMAQGFNIQIGPDGDRRERQFERRIERGPIVEERRVIRRGPRTRTVCRTQVQERIRPNGVVVRRPVEVCREVVGSRRFVD